MIRFIYYLLKYKWHCDKHLWCGRCVDCEYYDKSFKWDETYRERWANKCKIRYSLAVYFFHTLPCNWRFEDMP